ASPRPRMRRSASLPRIRPFARMASVPAKDRTRYRSARTAATAKATTIRRRTCRATRIESDRLFELGHELEKIADEAVVGDLEDRRLGILVDRDDRAGVLDAGQVLDRAG